MRKVRIGDVTIDAVIEREGPWRRPQDFFPAYDDATFKRHLQVMEPEVFDPGSGKMFITYQTFVVRTPHHTILVDTCTGEEKRGIRHHSISPARSAGGMNCLLWVSATRRLITCSARISISTTPAGIRPCVMDVGCRRFRMRNMCSTRGNTLPGKRRARGAPILLAACSVITACQSWKPVRLCSLMTTMLWMMSSR